MPLLPSLRTGSLTLSLALSVAHVATAQSAAEILKKVNAVYGGVKTYQAVILTDLSGAFGSVSQTVEIKVIPNRKASVSTRINGKPTGQLALVAAQLSTRSVDDGKTMYTYLPGLNRYMKRPHMDKTNGGVGMLLPQLSDLKPDSCKLLAPVAIDGKPAYAIEIASPAKSRGATKVVYIDKASYHIRQMKIDGSSGPQMGATNVNMVVKSEKFNQPIPDSVFTFTPPAGATEMPGMGGMMGGAPAGGR